MEAVYSDASRDLLGPRRRKNCKEWIGAQTYEALRHHQAIRKQKLNAKSPRLQERLTAQYQEVNREVKRSARRDKRAFVEEMALKAEEAARRKDQGELYKITKTVCRKFHNDSNALIADKQGRLITSKEEQDKRWVVDFQEVFNQPELALAANVESRGIQVNISQETPTLREIEYTIKTLKNGKAPGPDMLCPEMFKADPKYSANTLMRPFESIWRCKKVPADWKKSTIVKIPKKGTRTNCNNWRGITVLSVPGKILAKIIYKRICTAVDDHLRQEQAGLRKGRGCVHHIFLCGTS